MCISSPAAVGQAHRRLGAGPLLIPIANERKLRNSPTQDTFCVCVLVLVFVLGCVWRRW